MEAFCAGSCNFRETKKHFGRSPDGLGDWYIFGIAYLVLHT